MATSPYISNQKKVDTMSDTPLERRVRVIPAKIAAPTPTRTRTGNLRVAAYCRVSTDSEEQLNSYEAQKDYYTQKISENPEWDFAGIYADEGITGTSMKKRTAFNKMIAACRRGRIDLIVTKSLSRFARNTVDCLETVRMLKANGIGVIFEKENVNTLTESSEFLITLFSGFAQAESESLSKNVSWGIRKSMESGKVAIQYSKLLGYRKGEDGQPEIVPEEAETVREIYRMYLDGSSLTQIKRTLDETGTLGIQGNPVWSVSTIRSILTNEKYIGDALLQKTYITDCISKTVRKNNGERPMYYVENHHEGIIPKAVFQRVQEEMARRTSKRKVMQKNAKTEQGKYSGKYALTERLVCGECGSPYKRCTWTQKGEKRIVWRCVSRLEFGKKYCHNSPTMDEDKLHSAIVAALNQLADTVAAKDLALECAEAAILGTEGADLKLQLQKITKQQDSLLDQLLENMDDSELITQMQSLTEQKQALLEEIAQQEKDVEKQRAEEAKLQEIKQWLEENPAGLQEYDDQLTRQYIERITVVDKSHIRVKFIDVEEITQEVP
jgi:DNA invertase Pin-like site-specific DNA recombinase